MWIEDGRVIARDWRPYAEARGDFVLSMAGDAYRVRVSARMKSAARACASGHAFSSNE